MTFIKRPAPELLTFKNWYTSVSAALDGSGYPSGTYSDFQPSKKIALKSEGGKLKVKSFDLTMTVLKERSWIINAKSDSRAARARTPAFHDRNLCGARRARGRT